MRKPAERTMPCPGRDEKGWSSMGKKYLIVVDMQQDFVYGALGTAEAQAIVPAVAEKVKGFDGTVIYTRDTHQADYLHTQEGIHLPVEHCIEGTAGWELVDVLKTICQEQGSAVYQKGTFGCVELAAALKAENEKEAIESIELVGVCTDICVVSNALLLKAYMPEVHVLVDLSFSSVGSCST